MPATYNPVVRTFCRLRAALLKSAAVDRRDVRPDSPLDVILPASCRRQVWSELRQAGLDIPSLELTEREYRRGLFEVLRAAISTALNLRSWWALLSAIPLGFVAYRVSRRYAVQFPLGLRTFGELVIYATDFREGRRSGYRWSRGEIEMKVRLIIAEQLGLTLDKVRPETRLADLMD